MPPSIELIVGPARSGKARRLLEAYAEAYHAAEGPGRCLMVVPTADRQRATVGRLLDVVGAGVLVAPQVLTLPALADRLLTAAGRPVQRIGQLARRQLIRDCIEGLSEKDAAALGRVREAPGLVDALDVLFREMKAARIEPDDLLNALTGRLRTDRNRLLGLLYHMYQQALQARDVYDDKGQFWHAAGLVEAEQFGPFGELDLLAVDGFQDFEPAQLDVLEALAGRAERTVITLTWEPGREELFAATGRTRVALRERFGNALTETTLDAPSGLPADLEHLRRNLFTLPDENTQRRPEGQISLIRAAGKRREVEEVARQIVDRLAEADDPPHGHIAVIARGLGAYAPLVEQVFGRYGIPYRIEQQRSLAEYQVIRAVMAVGRLHTEDYAYRAVARLLGSNYIRPEAFGGDRALARAAVRLVREANVWGTREAYGEGLGLLANQVRREIDRDDPDEDAPSGAAERLETIERAADLLRTSFETLELPARGSPAELAGALATVIEAAGIRDSVRGDPDELRRARDLKALAALEEMLDEVADLAEDDEATWTLPTFLREVTRSLHLTKLPREGPPTAPVVVMDAHKARALGFDHVILVGLAEKEFPRRGQAQAFFSDRERRTLRSEHGLLIRDAGHDAEDEMFLFYMAATRAACSLTLSYPSLDDSGRPVLPSHYLDQAVELFAADTGEEDALPTVDIGTRDLDLPAERIRAERDLLAAQMHRIWGPGETPDMDDRLGVLAALDRRDGPASGALDGLAIEWQRERGDAFDAFDGLLSAPDLVADLCERIPGASPMSAGRLGRFGRCPWAYLARDLMGLEAIEEPARDLGPLEMGLVYHDVLERFFREAIRADDVSFPPAGYELEAALALLRTTAGAYFDQLEAAGGVGSQALWKVRQKNILSDLEGLVAWHAEKGFLADWRPAHLEVAFGGRPDRIQPPGRSEPLVIDTPHGPLRLRGRIDRIDLAEGEDPGFQVIDYKSGSGAAGRHQKGTDFQLPVYVWATSWLLGMPLDESVVEAWYLPIRHPARSGRLYNTSSKGRREAFDRDLVRARLYIRNFLEAMRQGQYPVWPRGRNGCPSFCEFGEICRHAEWRLERKWEAAPLPLLDPIGDEEAEAELERGAP